MLIAAATLALIWVTNFLLVLPVLNAVFIKLMPYGATLFSKVLFGITMGWVMQKAARLQPSRSL